MNPFITSQAIVYSSGDEQFSSNSPYTTYYFDSAIYSFSEYGKVVQSDIVNKSVGTLDQIFIPIDSSGTPNNSGVPSMEGRLYPSGMDIYGSYLCLQSRGDGYSHGIETVGPVSGDLSVRLTGFRTPIYIAGYGLTPEGKPAFNATEVDGYEEEDKEIVRRHKNIFPKDYQLRPNLWKAGPLDVRWDNSRGVWYSGPPIVEGYAIQDIPSAGGRLSSTPYTSGYMVIYTGGGSGWNYNYASGDPQYLESEDKVLLINRSLDLSIQSGMYVQAMHYPNGEYRPFWVDCTVDPSGAMNRLSGVSP